MSVQPAETVEDKLVPGNDHMLDQFESLRTSFAAADYLKSLKVSHPVVGC